MPTTAKLSISFINNGISSYYVILFDSFSLFMINCLLQRQGIQDIPL